MFLNYDIIFSKNFYYYIRRRNLDLKKSKILVLGVTFFSKWLTYQLIVINQDCIQYFKINTIFTL